MKEKKNGKEWALGILGLAFACLLCLPYLLLGEKSIVTYHDQLDGEMITYLLNAKHLFQNMDVYPEVMGGIPKNGMVSPAPLYVLFYKLFPPFVGFLCCMLLNKLVQFLFTYLLILKRTDRSLIAFALGIWFACLPFYPVYGLCIPGQPMLYYAFDLLREGGKGEKQGKGWAWKPLLLIAFYGASSSLALCGFALLAVLFVRILWGFFRESKREALFSLGGAGLLGITYVTCNLSLVGQLLHLGKASFLTHKSEMKAVAVPFLDTLRQVVLNGEDYCNAYSIYVMPIIGIAIAVGGVVFLKKKKAFSEAGEAFLRDWERCLGMLALILLIAIYRALYQTEGIVRLRNQSTGVLHDFNFGRFTWLLPVFWILCMAYACTFLLGCLEKLREKKQWKKWIMHGATLMFCLCMAIPALMGLYRGDLKPNLVKLLRGGDYEMMTWEQFFAAELFERVEEVIGRPKEEYHVVSLGIYPAAAAYNGFYCLDGYSNNYDLAYKHKFRKVISPQLDKSDYLREWFDDWGNRCYIVLAQYNNYFTLEKKWGPYSEDYELDLESLKELGGNYVISASYLIDGDKNGLRLLNEEPIQTEDSWYRLWVYEIK